MISKLYSGALVGVDGVEVEVEVDLSAGNQKVIIVGLPDTALKESSQRVATAISNSQLSRHEGVFIVNLAPADLRKQGPGFDLAIALGMVACTGAAPVPFCEQWCIVGELSLDGTLRPVRGVLPVAIEAMRRGRKRIMVPTANALEASVVEGIAVFPVDTLQDAWKLLNGELSPPPFLFSGQREEDHPYGGIDFEDVRGQPLARRAMEIAAAGSHNILLSGSPGTGKSMLAQRLPTILPHLTEEEAIATSKIHSVCGKLPKGGLIRHRPFRDPHHTISDAGLMGGGSIPAPGEVSLAHNGVLFLDELPEFRRQTLETLRQPLETGTVVISRASGSLCFPCQFMLVAAMNPCPCGYFGDPKRQCRCHPKQIDSYRQRISGPLLDRFDLLVQAPAIDLTLLGDSAPGEPSALIRSRVIRAREIQLARSRDFPLPDSSSPPQYNSRLSGKSLREFCKLAPDSVKTLHLAMNNYQLSARAHDRILKVARTIADLAAAESIAEDHLLEAISLRAYDAVLRGQADRRGVFPENPLFDPPPPPAYHPNPSATPPRQTPQPPAGFFIDDLPQS